MSYEVANQEIALSHKSTYPQRPGDNRVDASGLNTGAKIYEVLLYQGRVS